MNTSVGFLPKSYRRRTARDATIVDDTAAGTLKMIDMIGFRLRSMKTVAIKFARNLVGDKCQFELQWRGEQ